MFRVKFIAYCGMVTRNEQCETDQQARFVAARILKHRRRKYGCTTLEKGKSWEVLEPDDCMMVPDACGVLHIIHDQFECRECGAFHETREEAQVCCTGEEE